MWPLILDGVPGTLVSGNRNPMVSINKDNSLESLKIIAGSQDADIEDHISNPVRIISSLHFYINLVLGWTSF